MEGKAVGREARREGTGPPSKAKRCPVGFERAALLCTSVAGASLERCLSRTRTGGRGLCAMCHVSAAAQPWVTHLGPGLAGRPCPDPPQNRWVG